MINHSSPSCLVLELEISCDMRYHLGPLSYMRFFNGIFFLLVHQTILDFWVYYSTWVLKKYGSIKPGIFSLMCFDGPIFYFSVWKCDVVWWTKKTDLVWWTLILMWFNGPFRSIKPHLCQNFYTVNPLKNLSHWVLTNCLLKKFLLVFKTRSGPY